MRRFVALLACLLVVLTFTSSPASAAASGRLDPSFGTSGKVLTNFTGSDAGDGANALAIQPDGKIVAEGFATSQTAAGGGGFALARYNTHGHLDTSFGTSGKVLTDFNGSGGKAFTVAIQPDGKIDAAGFSLGPSGERFA